MRSKILSFAALAAFSVSAHAVPVYNVNDVGSTIQLGDSSKSKVMGNMHTFVFDTDSNALPIDAKHGLLFEAGTLGLYVTAGGGRAIQTGPNKGGLGVKNDPDGNQVGSGDNKNGIHKDEWLTFTFFTHMLEPATVELVELDLNGKINSDTGLNNKATGDFQINNLMGDKYILDASLYDDHHTPPDAALPAGFTAITSFKIKAIDDEWHGYVDSLKVNFNYQDVPVPAPAPAILGLLGLGLLGFGMVRRFRG